MMRRFIFAASVLLLLQIGLVVVFQLNRAKTESALPHTLFLSITPDKVTSLTIAGTEGQQLVLQKTDYGWALPNSYNSVADNNRVMELLEKLATVKQGLAVATSPEAAQRFKTATDSFERHLVIYEDEKAVGDFYLGTSAGFRYSHVRIAGQDNITTIPVSNFEVETEAEKWLDKNQVKHEKDKIKEITLGDIFLKKENNTWSLSGVASEKVNKEEMGKVIDKVASVPVQAVLNPHDVSALFTAPVRIQFTVKLEDNRELTYAFAKQEEHHVLKVSDSGLFFKVNNWLVDSLAGFSIEGLMLKEDANTDPEQQNENPLPENTTGG